VPGRCDLVDVAGRGQIAGPRWEIYGHRREDPSEVETEIGYVVG
jgi:hypothetical protein